MSFADKLIRTPRREKSGETGYERYDYQASWGLALIFESHDDLDDGIAPGNVEIGGAALLALSR